MSRYAPWPIRTSVPAGSGAVSTFAPGSLASASPFGVPDDLVLQQAALDGALPYDQDGATTLHYWTGGLAIVGGRTVAGATHDAQGYPVGGEPIPSQVTQWCTDYRQQPIVALSNQLAQGTIPDWATVYPDVGELYARLLAIARLQTSGTLAAWPAPAGGTFPPFSDPSVTADLPGADLTATLAFLQAVANSRYQGIVGEFPNTLAFLPGVPFPEAAIVPSFGPGGNLQITVTGPANAPVQTFTPTPAAAAATTQRTTATAVPMQTQLDTNGNIPTGNAGVDAGGSPPNGAARATGPSPGGAGPVSVVQNGPAAQPVAAGNQVPPVAPMPTDQSNTHEPCRARPGAGRGRVLRPDAVGVSDALRRMRWRPSGDRDSQPGAHRHDARRDDHTGQL